MTSRSIASVLGLTGMSLATSLSFVTVVPAATLYVDNTGSPACSDSNPGTSPSAPLCTISSARNKSAANDTVLVTPSTYPISVTLDIAAAKTNQTWQRANTSGYVTLDLGGTVAHGIWVHAPGVTIDGFKIINQSHNTEGNFPHFGIFVDAVVGMTIRNCYIDVTYGTTAGVQGCNSCMCGIGFQAGKFLIENNTIRGAWSFGIFPENTWLLYANKPASYDPPDLGGTIRNNTIIFEGPNTSAGSQLGMLIETVGQWDKHSTWLIYNNQFLGSAAQGSGREWAMYPREIAVTMRVWNNYMVNTGTCFYLQEAFGTCIHQNASCAAEDVAYFNNTCDAGSTVNTAASGVFWSGCVNSNYKNNIFKNFGYGFDFRGLGGGCTSAVLGDSLGGGPHDIDRSGQIFNNLMYRTSNPISRTHFTYYSAATSNVDINTSSPQNSSLGSYAGNIINVSPNLSGGGLLQSGSPAIDAGSNNPLGQGPNVCSVSDGTRTVSCLVDANGTPRGSGAGWDIGWDEYVPAGPGDTPPPAPTNLSRGDKGLP